ncbi:MAG: transcriptional regulator [Phycisphaerales bacterium]|nr:transcriptional regulator [Phycisphaerales bacterium]
MIGHSFSERATLMALKDEIKKRKPFDSPAEEAFLNLLRTHGVMTAELDHVFKQFGVSEPKYNILRILRGARQHGEYGGEGVPCLEVGVRMVARVPDVTRLVDRLEADALVARRRSTSDRRVVYVAITDKGLALLDAMHDPLTRLHGEQARHLTPAEWAELSRLLAKARQRPDPAKAD